MTTLNGSIGVIKRITSNKDLLCPRGFYEGALVKGVEKKFGRYVYDFGTCKVVIGEELHQCIILEEKLWDVPEPKGDITQT